MALKDMTLSKQDMEKMDRPILSEKPKYPYGLRLCLDSAALKKLGMEGLPEVGSKVMVMAQAEVVSVSAHDSAEGWQNKSCDLQIVAMEIEAGKTSEEHAESLYSEESE